MQDYVSLLELNQIIKETLEFNLEPEYWVIAEIAELSHARQGHAYLDLVEKQGNQITAKIRANIWSYTFRGISSRFKSITGQDLKTGMRVLALVSVTYHEIYGLSLNVRDIDPDFTLGERARMRQEIILKLQQEGMLELNKRLILPVVPQKIAIISSSTAAGYGDFINQIDHNRYGYCIHYQLFQASLQGKEAPFTLIQAIQNIKKSKIGFDAVVIIRGGGAQLDLDCFDDYDLAVEIATCPLPVITGIGHERDETIADLVAHTRMKTPTAAAEFILSGFMEFEETIFNLLKTMERNMSKILALEDRKLLDYENRIQQQSNFQIQRSEDVLRHLLIQVKNTAMQKVKVSNLQLENLNQNLRRYALQQVSINNENLERLERDLHRLNPNTFLERGYTRSEINGIPVFQAKIEEGSLLTTYAKNLKILSTIKEVSDYGK
ncbi:exodeoxyribonuclease VII large subunit [Shivajiella indica]|uniref:Exodeoxyribonuclease 7 large subunit n=1 Tax=Shivajiella indica TaxID=872115 RepID=A0ABW5B9R2_9BACT